MGKDFRKHEATCAKLKENVFVRSVPYFRTKFHCWHPCTRARTALVRCKASMSMFPFTVELSHFGPHLGCAVLNLNASSSRQPTSFCNSHISQCKLEHAGKSFLISSDVFVLPHTFAIFESEAVLTGDTPVQPKEKSTYHASHKIPESAWRRWLSMIFNGIVFSKLLDLDEKNVVGRYYTSSARASRNGVSGGMGL
jgi:hypothetical protein